jgi:hypothetical protein
VSCNLRESLMDCIDKILGVREGMGAQLADVSIVTRTWSGSRPGDGSYTDVEVKITPTPEIVDYSHNIRISEAGAFKSGDLLIKSISMNGYSEEDLTTTTNAENVEKMYKVGKHYYSLRHIKESLVTWDVHLRKLNQDESER